MYQHQTHTVSEKYFLYIFRCAMAETDGKADDVNFWECDFGNFNFCMSEYMTFWLYWDQARQEMHVLKENSYFKNLT